MPVRTYKSNGKTRERNTFFRELAVREPDWVDMHVLSEACDLSLADTFAMLVQEGLRAVGKQPYSDRFGLRTGRKLPIGT